VTAGPVTAVTVEVELTAGSWTDISTYLATENGVTCSYAMPQYGEAGAPSQATLVLRNDDGRFTPDNPTSPYAPEWGRGKRMRITVTKGSARQVFIGAIITLTLAFPSGTSGTSQVTVGAVDGLAALGRRTMRSAWAEHIQWEAADASVTADVWPLDLDASARSLPAIDNDAIPASVIDSTIGGDGESGTLTAGGSADGIYLDGSVQVGSGQYVDKYGAGDLTGPVLRVQPRSTSRVMTQFWFRSSVQPSDILSGLMTICGLRSGGAAVADVALYVHASTDVGLLLSNPNTGGTLILGVTGGMNDSAWHSVTLRQSSTSVFLDIDGVERGSTTMDLSTVDEATYGGRIEIGGTLGKNVEGYLGDLAGIAWIGTVLTDLDDYARPGTTWSLQSRWIDLGSWAGTALVAIPGTVTGTDNRTVGHTPTAGRTVLDVAQELARTAGGCVWIPPVTGIPTLVTYDTLHPGTASLALTLEADDSLDVGEPVWADSVDEAPTRVTASSPAGPGLAVDAAAEAGGERRDATVDTCAPSATDAGSVAAMVLAESTDLRLRSIGLDLASAQNDLYAAVLSATPGILVSVAGVDSGVCGVSATDGLLREWQITFDRDSTRVVLGLAPSRVEGVTDDAEYGRVADEGDVTVDSGTAVGTTSTGTVVATLGASADFSTDSADYPVDLDWQGERVTVGSAPSASAAGAQTLTLTARGVAPTVARSHPAGDTLTVWHAAAASI